MKNSTAATITPAARNTAPRDFIPRLSLTPTPPAAYTLNQVLTESALLVGTKWGMETAILGVCLCACGGTCALWRRGGGGEVGRKVRRTIATACVVASCLTFYFSLFLSSPAVPRGGLTGELGDRLKTDSADLPLFRLSVVNCSLPPTPRDLLRGEVGVASRHQWFHAVGHSLDDLRVHWAFPQQPGVSGWL